MEEEKNKRSSWRDNLRNKYRLVLLNDDSFEEIRSYNLTPLNVYIIVSSVLFLTSTLLVLLIIFTPIKNLIPGYGEVGNIKELTKINGRIGEMQTKLNLYETQNSALKRKLLGQFKPEEQTIDKGESFTKEVDNVKRIEEDELLRKEVELNDKLIKQKEQGILPQKNIKNIFFFIPVKGTINASFSRQKKHLGTDIIAPKNTPINSVLDGVVIFSDFSNDAGNTIIVQHDYKMISIYKHASSLLKNVGDKVKGGEVIAIIGNSGEETSGPHLHFEMWHDNVVVNSEDYIIYP